jgi:hypothetical protein
MYIYTTYPIGLVRIFQYLEYIIICNCSFAEPMYSSPIGKNIYLIEEDHITLIAI